MAGGVHDRPRFRLEGLDEHAPRRIAATPAGELRDQLERPFLGTEVRQPEPGVDVDHGCKLDALKVMPFRHHLRSEQHGSLCGGESCERRSQVLRLRNRVRVEPNQLQVGQLAREVALELLRPRAQTCEVRGAAGGAQSRRVTGEAAVMAPERRVAVEDERDVAVRTADRRPARATMERRRDPAAVQEQDCLAPVLRDAAKRIEQRRRQRIPRLAAQVDDAYRRQRRAQPAAEVESFERRPRLRPRRCRPVDGDRAFERGALCGDGARVVARVGVLLVRGIVFLVDHDQPEPADRRKHGRPRANDDPRVAARDALALVAPLGLGQSGMENRDLIPEARPHAADGLRRERDLGNEDDRAEATLEHRHARLEVDLRLAGAGRAVEQDVSGAAVDDAGHRRPLRLRELRPAPPRRRATAVPPAAPAPCDASARRVRRARAHVRASSRSSRRARARGRRAWAGSPRRPPRSAVRRLLQAPRPRAR